MPDRFEVSVTLEASASEVFQAWLDSATHAAIIGGSAEITPEVGGEFRIWDGYITGRTLALDPPHRIVQAWRTSEFPAGSADSLLEVLLSDDGPGTILTLVHRQIPDGQGANYEAGWKEHYFEPMKAYFSGLRRGPAPA